MNAQLNQHKGKHPGLILEQELDNRNIRKGPFALEINEYPQTLSAITKGKRGMNTPLAFKIERALGIEEGYFMTLQVYYEIEEEKKKLFKNHPDLTKLRPILFWDTKIEKLDWNKQKRAIIKRIFERGNHQEKKEISRFYGEEVINDVLNREHASL